jgi:hypothetical protein
MKVKQITTLSAVAGEKVNSIAWITGNVKQKEIHAVGRIH